LPLRHRKREKKPKLVKRCGKRLPVKWGQTIDSRNRGRSIVEVVNDVVVTANNGVQRTLVKGMKFFNCGCDSAGTCVIYGDRDNFFGTYQKNADGTTFYANIPRKVNGVKPLKFTKSGAKRVRGAVPLKKAPKKMVKRAIIATPIRNEDIVHGPGAPMWEYTWLASGTMVTGAETPASFWKNGKKLGTGYNTGLFKPGVHKFYDVCAPLVKTPVRRWLDVVAAPVGSTGPGTVTWVFGYVKVEGGAKVWAWMIKGIQLHAGKWKGNVAM